MPTATNGMARPLDMVGCAAYLGRAARSDVLDDQSVRPHHPTMTLRDRTKVRTCVQIRTGTDTGVLMRDCRGRR